MRNPNQHTSEKRKQFLYFFLSLISIYAWIFFGFNIRDLIPSHYNLSYVLFFFVLIYFLQKFSRRIFKYFIGIDELRRILIMIFLVLNFYLLYQMSSSNRENEIRSYFAKNESGLRKLVNHYKDEKDKFYVHHPEEVNAESFRKLYGYDNIILYTCPVYGYEIIYSDSAGVTKPKVVPLGAKYGSPVRKWIKLKDHWYYCSFLD